MPILTTITPYWQRPAMLNAWLRALAGATTPDIEHLVFFVGEPVPAAWGELAPPNARAVECPEEPGLSIGHYHNIGCAQATTEWFMKLDVDALPNVRYFAELLKVIARALPREWFNGGALAVGQAHSEGMLKDTDMPLGVDIYQWIVRNLASSPTGMNQLPGSTNFVCRRADYLAAGGCDEEFRGWGWEDYLQTFMLERNFRQAYPLAKGVLNIDNVTHRCRAEITRPKAVELWQSNSWLCLLHRWHPKAPNTAYKNRDRIERNRQILLDRLLAVTS